MLDSNDFDDWSATYDQSVERSDEAGSYPFAGYERIMSTIYERVLAANAKSVLDVGFGTATLAKRLYDEGVSVFGQDFSAEMVLVAQEKMPKARLYHGDFTRGLVPELADRTYDAIVATYSLHHLDDAQKARFIGSLLERLSEGGTLYIGDVAFETRSELEVCRNAAGDTWDPDEVYFVCDELRKAFPQLAFERMSPCAGLITLRR